MSNKEEPRPDPRLEAVRAYAARGWRLVLNHGIADGQCTCADGSNCQKPGKHPAHRGWLDTDLSVEDVAEHLRAAPNLNLGILTGAASGLLVLDVDPRNGGLATLAQLQAELGSLPETPTARTGGGGPHYYFRCPHPEVKSPANGLGPGVDIRCARAQVVAPPSMHASGQQYAWEPGHSPDEVPLAALPDAWMARMLNSKQRQAPTTKCDPGVSRLADDAVLYSARSAANADKFEALWRGESPSGDRSADDLGFCRMLAFWCNKDPKQMDRLFRRSGRTRAKWTEVHRGDGATYGEMTIEVAIKGCKDTYTGGRIGGLATDGGQNGGAGTSGNGSNLGNPGADNATADSFHLTDLGNALRLVTWYGKDVRYVPQRSTWLAWDGRRWREDGTREVQRLARQVAERLWSSAVANTNQKLAKMQVDFAERSESARAQQAMVELAKADKNVVQRPEDFDRDDWLLNCLNGTLDLRTGQLRPHDRGDLITCRANAEYDTQASCPQWTTFLGQIFLGDAHLIRYVQQVLGLGLTGSNVEQFLWVFNGRGDNGKNALLETARRILGDYAAKAAPDLLTQASMDRHPTEIADLAGKRLVIASETDEGRRLAISFMKQATGDDTLKARKMRQDFWEFRRTFKLILVTNNLPRVREESHAVWRRLRVVPFDYVVPKAKIDKDLLNKLLQESAGILAWLVRGCRGWQANGLVEPRAVTERSAAYRDREDMIAEFVQDACLPAPNGAVTTSALRAAYTTWCREHGTYPLSPTALGDRVAKLPGVHEVRTGASRGFVGISLDVGYERALPDVTRGKLLDFKEAMRRKHTPGPPQAAAGGVTP